MLPLRVKVDFARGGDQRMLAQNHNLPSPAAGKFVQPLEQLDLLRGEQLSAEAADVAKGGGFAKNKGARRPFAQAADEVPELGQQPANPIAHIELDGATSGNGTTFFDGITNIFEQWAARVRIGIDKDQPLAGGDAGTAVARPTNLIYRLENDSRATGGRNFRRAIGGIVVADDDLIFPVASRHGVSRAEDAFERGGKEFLLIECRYDNGNFHVSCRNRIARGRILSGRA